MMKFKKIIVGSIAFVLAFGHLGTFNVKTASAGQDDFIMPYYNGYVESGATILSQDTVIDMSVYNGAGGVGFDSGIVTATSEYLLNVTQENATFYMPYAGRLDDLNEMSITVNGANVTPERIYGDMPYYHAGLGGDGDTILKSIASVKPSTLEGAGKLYTFETSEEPLEYSFLKQSNQTVLHSGLNWSSYGADRYSIKYNTNTNEEYPYKLFVTDGELQNFSANVSYEISDITYKDFLDFYVDELIAEIGEEYRAILYSNFNRQLDGQIKDVYDVVYQYSGYVFALLKTTLPLGNVTLTIVSRVKPMVNGLYKPYIYVVRTVSAYPQNCAYSLEVKTSNLFPYVIEDNIGFAELKHESTKQIADGYYIVSSEKKPDYALDNEESHDKNWLWLWIVGGVVCGGCVGILVWWLWGVAERRRRR